MKQLMLRIALLCSLLFAPSLAFAQVGADAILGTYLTEGGKSKVVITKQGNTFVGTTSWLRKGDILDEKNPDKAEASKKLTGKVILRGLQYDDKNEYKGGKIYDPESGKTYSCKATAQEIGDLRVRGFIGAALFGRTTTWKRVK